ncbi:MAG: Gfo/Idh/MocA family oxidoreductase [Planctomycetes bacterium]|nr:Gfo/Idh/MocA family oxidoreductase [Planctomycetota bacterium]
MSELKVAFAGAGHIAQAHAQTLAAMPGLRLVGFCDVDRARADATARAYPGAEAFDDAVEMYDAVEPDAVYVCVTPNAHGRIEKEAAKRGIHLFIEKPICIDGDTGREIEAALLAAGVVATAGYQNRYRRSVERAKELLAQEPAILTFGHWIGHMYRVPWWGDRRTSGGQLVEQTTHTVDLIRYLLGEPVEIIGRAAHGFVEDVEGYNNDDASAVTFVMPNGSLAVVLSCCANIPGYGVGLKIFTRRQTLDFTGWEHTLNVRKSKLETETVKGEENIFALEDAAFVDAVRHKDPSRVRCTYGDALRTTLLTLAATQVLATGQGVRL